MTGTGQPYVFVSYASADRERVLPVVDALTRIGVSVWLDQHGIAGGENYALEITEAIEHAAALMLMCSAASLSSRNVKQEIALAWKFERPYVPLLLEPVTIPKDVLYWLEAAQWIEAFGHPEREWLPQVLAGLAPLGIVPPQPQQITTRLAGREKELALLREKLAAAREGHGGLVLIGGEAGIGKTTLAEAVLREAAGQDFILLEGHCFDLAETPPYGPWIDLFARYQPSPSSPTLPDAFKERGTVGAVSNQMALFVQVQDFLAALSGARPIAMLLDDLHWSDPTSLDLLRYLARSVADAPLLIIVTYRSDELTRRHPLSALLPQLAREAGAARIDLGHLDDDAVRSLVDDRYGLPDADAARLVASLQARAEGNALFVGELLRSLEEDGTLGRGDEGWRLGDIAGAAVPALLRQVIEGRVARLDDEAQRLLIVAAVIGHEIMLDVWATVAEANEDAVLDVVERGLEARLMVEASGGEGVRFAHALIREALYEGLPAIRRRRVHRRAGESLAEGRNPDPDAVAYHFQQAGDERAAAWLMRAGERAYASHAYVTAVARFEQALPRLMGVERAITLLSLASLHRHHASGIAEAEEAVHLATEGGEAALAALARVRLGASLIYRGAIERAIAEITAGSAVLDALPADAVARLALVGVLAANADTPIGRRAVLMSAFAFGGWYARAMETLGCTMDEGRDRLEALPLNARSAIAWVCSAFGRGRDARAAITSGRAWLAAREDWTFVAMFCVYLLIEAHLPYFADDSVERAQIVAAMDDALARHVAAGGAPPQAQVLWPVLVLEGRWAEARRRWAASTEYVTARSFAMPHIGELLRAQGEREMAWGLVHEALPDGPSTEPGGTFFVPGRELQCLAASLALDAGDLRMAKEWSEAHDRWLAWSGAVRGLSEGDVVWARYQRQTGEMEKARQHAERALAHATEPRQPLALLAAHRLLGELDTDAGRFDEAATHLDSSLALATACGAPYERALTLLAMAELRAAADTDDANRLLDQVRAICEPLGAKPALARAEALAIRVGVP